MICMLVEFMEYKAYCKRVGQKPGDYLSFLCAYEFDLLREGYWRKY